MIAEKFWRSFRGQLNKLANFLWQADPIALMQYEYDRAVDQLKEGRAGLEEYRALVERVTRQVAAGETHVSNLEAKVQGYLHLGDRDTAAKFALELQKARKNLAENEGQLALHEQAYENNLAKIKLAGNKLAQIREKIKQYKADLKMSQAEAEIAKLAQDLHFDASTDFGQIEQVVQDRISLNKAKTRVAADLSGQGALDLEREQALERALAEQALREFEKQASLPATVDAKIVSPKPLGPGQQITKQE